jgi:hypothetical protein
MDQGQAAGRGRQRDRPVKRRVTAAEHDEAFAGKPRRVADAIKQAFVLESVDAGKAQPARLEGTDAAGDEHRARPKIRAGIGRHREPIVIDGGDGRDLFAEMENGLERLYLLHQVIDEFLAAAHRDARNVVDRLVGVQLGTLAADDPHRVDDMRFYTQQTQFEDLEQAHGSGADNDDVCFDHVLIPCGVCASTTCAAH